MATANGRSARVRRFVTRRGAELTFTELGFGGAPIGNLYRPTTEKEARLTLETVWACGCRYFDTAPLYGLGLSETRLNGFLRPKARDSYLISTKVGRLLDLCKPQERSRQSAFFETPSRRERFDYTYDGVMRSFEFSLERLGLDAVDIVFVHDVDCGPHDDGRTSEARLAELMKGGYRALEELRACGAIRAIGAGFSDWRDGRTIRARGRVRHFPDRRALHAARPGRPDEPSAAVRGEGHRRRRRRPVQLGHPRDGCEGRFSLRLRSAAGRSQGAGAPDPAESARRSRSSCRKRRCAFRSVIRRSSASSRARSARAKPSVTRR